MAQKAFELRAGKPRQKHTDLINAFLQLDKTSGCDAFAREITKGKIHRHNI